MAVQLNELIDDLHLSNLHVERDSLNKFIEKCTVYPYDWGAIFHDGDDVHIHVLSSCRHRVFLRTPLRKAANILFEKYPFIKTSLLKSRGDESLEFLLRIGWKLAGEDNLRWFLEMKKEDFKYV